MKLSQYHGAAQAAQTVVASADHADQVRSLIREHQELLQTELMPRWDRVREQYLAGLSTKRPQELGNGKLTESKLVFGLVKKVAEKIAPPLYSIDMRVQQRHLELLMRHLLERILERDPDMIARIAPELAQTQGAAVKDSNALAALDDRIGLRRLARMVLELGLTNALHELRLTEILYGSEGVHHRMSLYGNAFVLLQPQLQGDTGVKLQIGSMRRICFERSAKAIRGDATEQNAQQMVMVLKFADREEAKRVMPEAAAELLNHVEWGLVPEFPEDEQSGSGAGHIVLEYDVRDEPVLRIMAGAQLQVLMEYKDKEYPHWHGDRAILPVVQFGCFGQVESLYHAGVGEYASQIANSDSMLRNALLQRYMQDSMPLEIIDVAAGYEHELKQRIERAEKLQQQGRRGIVINPFDDYGQQTVGGTRPLFAGSRQGLGDYQLLQAGLEAESIWLGVNLRNVATEATKTAAAVQMEMAAQTEIVEGIRRANATAYRELLELLVDGLRTHGRISSRKPLANSELETTEDATLQLLLGNITMGDVVWLLRELQKVQGRIDITLRDGESVEPRLPQQQTAQLQAYTYQNPHSPLSTRMVLPEAERSKMILSESDVIVPRSDNSVTSQA